MFAIKKCGGHPCVMGAGFVWPEDVASSRVVVVEEGEQVWLQAIVDVRPSSYTLQPYSRLLPDVRTGDDNPSRDIAIHSITFASNFFLA